MNSVKIEAAIRRERPEQSGFGLRKGGNVKFFIDKASRMLYPPAFICDGPTLRG
jgi:hypothetical protein